MIMKIVVILAVGLIVCLLIARNRRHVSSDVPNGIVVGGLYASRGDDGIFRVSKVLAVDDSAVHVRIYKNKFKAIPENLDTSTLSLGGLGDPDGFGIGHAPVAKGNWLASHVFLKKEPVREDELEGYKYYLEEMRKR
jgi:hypothetical protein